MALGGHHGFKGTSVATLKEKEEIAVRQAWDLELGLELELRRRQEQEKQRTPTRIEPNHIAYISAFPLKQFIHETFPIIEKGREFKENWHLDIICELLQATITGQVKNFIVNIPRRTMKSLLMCVMFPCWVWTFLPHFRFLFTSYSADFAKRDNEKCRDLVQSYYYQQKWGELVTLTVERRNKLENTRGGSREVFKIGKGTGAGADAVICLCYNTLITTETGPLPIGRIVNERLPVKILSFNHQTGRYVYEPIEKYEKSVGRKAVEITFSNGIKTQSTFDHPFYIDGKGYIPACELQNGDVVITHDSQLQNLQQRVQEDSTESGEKQNGLFLFSRLFCNRAKRREQCHMESGQGGSVLRNLQYQDHESSPKAYSPSKTRLLLNQMRGRRSTRRGQYTVERREGPTQVCLLQRDFLYQSSRSPTAQSNSMFSRMCRTFETHTRFRQDSKMSVRLLRQNGIPQQSSNAQKDVLQPEMCRFGASRRSSGRKERQVRQRQKFGSLPTGIFRDSSKDQNARRKPMPSLRYDGKGSRSVIGRTSHRLRQEEQQSIQFNHSLSISPRSFTRRPEGTGTAQKVFVEIVTSISTPAWVFNLRVPNQHNYFANGVLAHNCDDGNSIDEVESDVILKKTNQGWNEVSYHNVSDRNTAFRGIIQQRTAPNDLTGNITEDPELASLYDVLCLAMRYEADNPLANTPKKPFNLGKVSAFERSSANGADLGVEKLWIDPRDKDAPTFNNKWYRYWYKTQFADKGLESKGEGQLLWESYITEKVILQELSHLKAYGESAQYQQRPIRRGGNFFNSVDFEVVPRGSIDFNRMAFCRSWDKAGSQNTGDWTVGMLMARTTKRPFTLYIVDIFREQIGYYERMKRMKDIASVDTKDYLESKEDTEYTVIIERELAASGKDLATLERDALLGHHVIIDIPRGKKSFRAKPAKSMSEAGRIKVFKAPWNVNFFRELEKFDPDKDSNHDDQIDAMSMAVKFLIFGQTNQRSSSSGVR